MIRFAVSGNLTQYVTFSELWRMEEHREFSRFRAQFELSRLGHLSANRNQKPMLVCDVEQVKRPKSIIPTLVRGYSVDDLLCGKYSSSIHLTLPLCPAEDMGKDQALPGDIYIFVFLWSGDSGCGNSVEP